MLRAWRTNQAHTCIYEHILAQFPPKAQSKFQFEKQIPGYICVRLT